MPVCKVCGNRENLEIIKAKELFIGTREIFPYLLCAECGSLSIKEHPKNLNELYEKYPVFEFTPSGTGRWKKFLRQSIISNKNVLSSVFLKWLNCWEDLAFNSLNGLNLNKSMRILDVGCGNGMLIEMLKIFGFKDLTGIDPHLKKAIQAPGFRMLKAGIEDLKEEFDLVMCHHSFEHVEDPHAIAKSLENSIKPGGVLLIRFPNIESYSFLKFKESWHGIHAPFHRFLPSLKGMEKIFQNTNLKIEEIRYEQIVELFLYNINYSLNIGLMEPLGVIACLGDGPLGKKVPPLFTKKEISYWKEKTKTITKYKMTDYIAYYLKKESI